MCDKTKTAIEIIKAQKRKTLSKEETLMLFQEVIRDNEKMGERMTNLEKTVQEVKQEVSDVKADVRSILLMLEEAKKEKKSSFWERIPLLKEIPTWFWIILWTALIIFGGVLGVNPDFIQYIKTGG